MSGACVMLSGMIFTSESMQIYVDDNRSFESCQLDLETEAMKTSNENLLSWQACVHADMHTRRYRHRHTDYSQSPWECLDKWHFHMLKVNNEIAVVSINLGTLQLLRYKGSRQYKTLLTSSWKTTRLTAEECMLDHIKVVIIQGVDYWAKCYRQDGLFLLHFRYILCCFCHLFPSH